MKDQSLYKYLLILGDNSMILGHRLSELCGHGPSLETDIALTNLSLDFFGQVRGYFQYAAELNGGDSSEDSIAFLRYEREYYNVQLVEQPNTNFAHVIARQFLFDAFHLPLLKSLCTSGDERLSAIANKSVKESNYHYRFSSEWVKRLGNGTEESHKKMQEAFDTLYPFSFEFFEVTEVEKEMHKKAIGPDLLMIKNSFDKSISDVLSEATLVVPDVAPRQAEGKHGRHTEQLGFILTELQYMQRAYPNMEW